MMFCFDCRWRHCWVCATFKRRILKTSLTIAKRVLNWWPLGIKFSWCICMYYVVQTLCVTLSIHRISWRTWRGKFSFCEKKNSNLISFYSVFKEWICTIHIVLASIRSSIWCHPPCHTLCIFRCSRIHNTPRVVHYIKQAWKRERPSWQEEKESNICMFDDVWWRSCCCLRLKNRFDSLRPFCTTFGQEL